MNSSQNSGFEPGAPTTLNREVDSTSLTGPLAGVGVSPSASQDIQPLGTQLQQVHEGQHFQKVQQGWNPNSPLLSAALPSSLGNAFHHANRWQILAALAWCLDLKENIWRHLGQFKKNFENLITIEYNRENLSIRPVVAPYIVLGQLLSVDTVEEHQNELARILLQLHCRVMAYLFRAHSLLSSWVTMMLDLGTDVALQDFITGEKAGVILESIPMPFLEAGPVVRGFGCAFSSEFEDAVVCDLSERSSNDLLSICETAVKTYINSKRSTEGNHEALVTSLSMVLNLHRWDIDSVEWQKKLSQRMNMGM
ncbi:hypothetical protein QBC38DRAFT_516319 [Podospora fimiseda]|uniref:Uncharacterized protein n=1 Tax=Podospora fimiseda TaxID=252190 RepID=A0AAN7BVX4_9PEZI|nr:hypothetical protein QBC38DRAFT_516319 [Podospora fimiseda]